MALEIADLKDETEMENILKVDPEQIEKGLKVIANQVNTPKGRIDLLCVDADEVLTIVELKVFADENQFKQSVRYFDWAIENIDWLKDAYKISIADSKPRVVLVAQDFDEDTITLSKYWNAIAPITLYKYKCLLVENKKQVMCSEVSMQSPKEIQEKPKTMDDHLNYVLDENARNACKKAIDIIKKFYEKDLEVFPTKFYIGFRYKGRNFASIHTKRDRFDLGWR